MRPESSRPGNCTRISASALARWRGCTLASVKPCALTLFVMVLMLCVSAASLRASASVGFMVNLKSVWFTGVRIQVSPKLWLTIERKSPVLVAGIPITLIWMVSASAMVCGSLRLMSEDSSEILRMASFILLMVSSATALKAS